MLFFKRPAPTLTKIQAPTAAQVCSKYQPTPAAQTLLKPDQTPAEYLQALETDKQSTDAVNLLAHGMPERESVWWACQSSEKVAPKLNPAEQTALAAANSWVKNPTPETQAAAAAAAAKTDFTGPAGWAAQAAAWSQPTAPATGAPAAPAAPAGLVAPAVAGSVLLAAGLVNKPPMPAPKKPVFDIPTMAKPAAPVLQPMEAPALALPQPPPAEQAKFAKTLQPFIDLGKDVAGGKNSWA